MARLKKVNINNKTIQDTEQVEVNPVSETDNINVETNIEDETVQHKVFDPNTLVREKTSVKRARAQEMEMMHLTEKESKSSEVNSEIKLTSVEKGTNVEFIEMDESVNVKPKQIPDVTDSEIIEKAVTDTSVEIDTAKTYFEKLYSETKSEPEDTSFVNNMIPKVIDTIEELPQRVVKTQKPNSKFEVAKVVVVPSESVSENIETGYCQYVVNALYIIDIISGKKYLQGTILTLPDSIEKMPKVFASSYKSGRIVKYEDMRRKVEREVQAYDNRNRKWVKQGTPEYDNYMSYLQKKQTKITAANERKIMQERKRLGLE